MEFPNNPEQIPNKIRSPPREEDPQEILRDMREILDRMRRNEEYVIGGVNQEDKTVKDAVTLDDGKSKTVTLEAGENEFLYVSQAGVEPNPDSVTISMDEDTTQSNIDYRSDQKKVKNKVEIDINNNSGNTKTYNYFIDAVAVKVRE